MKWMWGEMVDFLISFEVVDSLEEHRVDLKE